MEPRTWVIAASPRSAVAAAGRSPDARPRGGPGCCNRRYRAASHPRAGIILACLVLGRTDRQAP